MGAPDPARDLPLIELAAGSLAIADLHLDPSAVEPCSSFLRFADAIHGTPALLILGDFYDAWVGRAHASLPGAATTIAALARLSASGTDVHVLHGNRDFLLDESFERLTGSRVHPRGMHTRLPGGSRCVWIHGDELCTLDHAYQRLRKIVRSAPVRSVSRAMPLTVGRAIARRLRSASTRAVAGKAPEEKSIQIEAAQRWAAELDVTRLVCGHAHEHRILELGGGSTLTVLDAFGGPHDLLTVEAGGELRSGASSQVRSAS